MPNPGSFRTGDLQDMWYARLKGKKMQDKSRDTGKEGCSKGGVQERRIAGKKGYRKREMKGRSDAGKEKCRKEGMQERRNAGKKGYRKGEM